MYTPMYHLRPLWPWQTPFFEELLSNKTTENGALQIVQLLLALHLQKKCKYAPHYVGIFGFFPATQILRQIIFEEIRMSEIIILDYIV